MNYQLIYDQLIQNRKLNPYEGYTEKHHIIPKSHGGNDSKENWVRLSAREHFIAHWLLWRIHRDTSMSCAFSMMCRNRNSSMHKNSYGFEESRRALSITMSQLNKGNEYTRGYKHTPETRERMSKAKKVMSVDTKNKMSEAKKDRILSTEHKLKISESGKGRVYPKIVCPHCNKIGGNTSMPRWHFDNCRKLKETA